MVKPPFSTHLFHPRGPLHDHVVLVGVLLAQRQIICQSRASPQLTQRHKNSV